MVAAAVPGTAPLGIVKRREEEFYDWLATERGFMTAFGRYGDEELKLESYQLRFMRDPAPYRAVEKARQVGYSFVFAIEALARTHLRDTHTSVFVSYNLSDAKEKIAYAQQMHEELPLEYQKKRIVDSKLELGFRSNSNTGRVSRIISHPSKAPRGKKGDIYLDELAHCANDREIYKGSTALIIRAGGQLTVCSTPLGRRGIFWELAREELRPYNNYSRQRVPWWLCSILCKDVVAAARSAREMQTADRVEKFGKKDLQDQFDALPLEDFQQEFEVVYSDESTSFYPYELIIPCTEDLELCEDFAELARHAEQSGERLIGGYDVGRKHDRASLWVFGETKSGRMVCRYRQKLEKVPFAEQEGNLRMLLETCPLARLSIDNSSIGMHLVENLSRDYPQVEPVDFSGAKKELWCIDFKISLQKKNVVLPRDRELVTQIHSIKKRVTSGGRLVFDADRDATGHADDFWAIALATKRERLVREPALVGVRIFG